MAEGAAQESAVDVLRKVFLAANQGVLDYSVLVTVAKLLGDAGNYSLASELYKAWLAKTNSSMADLVWCDLGDSLLLLNDKPGAEQAYRRALQINPGNKRATTALA